MFLGNRGGRFHRDDQTLGKRRWASRQWICCVLHFKGRHHPVWRDRYTALFFLDEPTAFAAGHRPCFECRRADAKAFARDMGAGERRRRAARARDGSGAAERAARRAREADARTRVRGFAGRSVRRAERARACAVRGSHLLRWSDERLHREDRAPARRARPFSRRRASSVFCGAGYRPQWHPTRET